MSQFSQWKPNPAHIRDFHIGNALSYRDLAHLLVRAVMTAPETEFNDAEKEVLSRFLDEGLEETRWTIASRPQDF